MYRQFAGSRMTFPIDWSENALQAQFEHESHGAPKPDGVGGIFLHNGTVNGYTHGKKWMDVWLTSVIEDLAQLRLPLVMLWDDYPDWFLRRVLPAYYVSAWDRYQKTFPA